MSIGRILVVGATGLIGAPVARRLASDGYQVRLLVRDPKRAETKLGPGFEYSPGSVTDSAAVDRAVQGVDGVHISLGVEDPALLEPVEHRGTAAVAQSAARHGLQRISYLTGSPLPVMAGIDRAFMGGKLAPDLQIMRLLARLGERGDPAPANELLAAPDTTVEAWCRAQPSTPR